MVKQTQTIVSVSLKQFMGLALNGLTLKSSQIPLTFTTNVLSHLYVLRYNHAN